MGTALFPLFKTGMISDDAPKGNYAEMKKNGNMAEVSAAASFRSGATNLNTWILFIQYACCFGVELTMNNAAASYFKSKFELSTESAAAIASIFGWMNLVSTAPWFRKLCDYYAVLNLNYSLPEVLEDSCLISSTRRWECVDVYCGRDYCSFLRVSWFLSSVTRIPLVSPSSSWLSSVCLSRVPRDPLTVSGIVPYVNPPVTGSISGVVGAGGNCGAVGFGLGFRQLETKQAFTLMASTIIASGALTFLICIKGHRGLITGQDSEESIAAWKKTGGAAPAAGTLQVPEPDAEAAEETEKEAAE
ncbi:hypothetical protein THAOC_01055 [Thalassiosira oceanica]|uniref:Major facilitator superfamily (MFS) profile domain-containing protein n=1 Tax=Thalassiosira oceanica TaxID=159749 RepID=K0TNH3_THAOC|nr:hypothetical protein THAOC_01055 [Thalassiosira oceanica]|eukprot:EJK77131.1 hypothetical protein THAOC_01055 [Thalassiosira oceanica]